MKLSSTFREEMTQIVSGRPVTLDRSFMFRFVFFKDGISVRSIFLDVSDQSCEMYLFTNSVEAIWMLHRHWETRLYKRGSG
jgi:hypothetical protein